MADVTLVNLNMLFIRYGEQIERELHVPLGPLYLTRALEDAGFDVDFRDYLLYKMYVGQTYTGPGKEAIPEPATLALLAFCGAALLARRRRRK